VLKGRRGQGSWGRGATRSAPRSFGVLAPPSGGHLIPPVSHAVKIEEANGL
jgi:hypothetical protein